MCVKLSTFWVACVAGASFQLDSRWKVKDSKTQRAMAVHWIALESCQVVEVQCKWIYSSFKLQSPMVRQWFPNWRSLKMHLKYIVKSWRANMSSYLVWLRDIQSQNQRKRFFSKMQILECLGQTLCYLYCIRMQKCTEIQFFFLTDGLKWTALACVRSCPVPRSSTTWKFWSFKSS